MNEKKKIKNYFFEIIFLIFSLVFSFYRAFKLFLFSKNWKNKNLFNDFLDFIFRKWPKYFWKKPTLYKIFSLPWDILNFIFKKK